MNKYNFRVSFVLCKDKNGTEDENLQIKASVTFNGQRVLYYTGYRVDRTNWEDEKLKSGKRYQQVKKNTFNRQGVDSRTINSKLNRIVTACDNLFKRFEGEDKSFISVEDVRKGLRAELKDEKPHRKVPIEEYYKEFVKVEGSTRRWRKSTFVKHATILRHLNEFRQGLCFEDVNEDVLNQFIDFLLFKKQLTNSYVAKLYDNLKWFFNWATEREYNKRLDYKRHHPKFPGSEDSNKCNVFALTQEELLRLYNMQIEQPSIAQVRDVFCFCCATSLRYSDVKALKWEDIVGDTLDLTTQKTNDHLIIPLTEMAKEIIKKYESNRGYTDYVLPVISNQKYNEYLKKLGKMANFNDTIIKTTYRGNERYETKCKKWELLTSHVARRTFVTIGLSIGIPSEIIRKITGHKTHKMLTRYEKLNASSIKENLKLFDEISSVFKDKTTVFDFNVTNEERLTLGIPIQELYLEKVNEDRTTAFLDLALLFYLRHDDVTSFMYAKSLPDTLVAKYLNSIKTLRK
jgi:integrase